jgi:hypothetical protein
MVCAESGTSQCAYKSAEWRATKGSESRSTDITTKTATGIPTCNGTANARSLGGHVSSGATLCGGGNIYQTDGGCGNEICV